MDDETYGRLLKVARDGFREQYESGDKLALLDCIRFCDQNDIPLRRWAIAELSEAAGRYLQGVSVNFHDAVLGARKEDGRHSNPATKRRASLSHQLLFDVVTALKDHGYKGHRLYERAEEILTQLRMTPDKALKYTAGDPRQLPNQETIKKRYETERNAGRKPTLFAGLMPDIIDMGYPPD